MLERDRDLVAAIVAGDPAGLAAAYDRYAAPLHAYCRALLREPADAADAVQDTFVIASAKLGGLRDPDLLRPWLYAVARNECRRRIRSRGTSVDLAAAGEMSDGSAPVGEGLERAELRDLVHEALVGLNPSDREVIELSLRHDLAADELALALGVQLNHAHALLSRARGQLERALGALLVARSGRGTCAELDALLVGWDGRLNVLLRKRVNRHIENCDACGERKRRELDPARLLSLLPVVALPVGLRTQVLQLVSDQSAAAAAHRAKVAERAAPFDRSGGFPRPLDPPARGLMHRRRAVSAAVLALLVVLGLAAAAELWHPASAPIAAPGLRTTSPAASSPSLVAGIATEGPSTGSPSLSPSALPTSVAATTAAITPSATPSSTQSTDSQAPRCHTSDLSATFLGGRGVSTSSTATIVLTNGSGHDCTIYGYPGLLQLDANGDAIPTTVVREATTDEQTVLLASGASAAATIQWSNVPANGEPTGGVCEPPGARLEITPPDETTQLVVIFGHYVCNHGTIDTSVFVPGTQGPA